MGPWLVSQSRFWDVWQWDDVHSTSLSGGAPVRWDSSFSSREEGLWVNGAYGQNFPLFMKEDGGKIRLACDKLCNDMPRLDGRGACPAQEKLPSKLEMDWVWRTLSEEQPQAGRKLVGKNPRPRQQRGCCSWWLWQAVQSRGCCWWTLVAPAT